VWCSRGRHGDVLLLDVLLPVCWEVTCKLSIAPNLEADRHAITPKVRSTRAGFEGGAGGAITN
jgi:hypothetical protein